MHTEHFKKKLEEELETVEKAINENTFSGQDEDPTATELDEIADKIEDAEEGLGENATLTVRRDNIKRALDKISQGKYGVCEIGGEPIEEERLEVDPAARTCMAHTD